uniref:Period circadian protein n=1 Tax=Limulus polyphemus TaxID=6850 RepID=A0A1B0YYR6_LIMPO|nr:PERa [Limulus polyphemus]
MKSVFKSDNTNSLEPAISSFFSGIQKGGEATDNLLSTTSKEEDVLKSLSLKAVKHELDTKVEGGFSVIISLLDGTTLHVTSSVTEALGYPEDFLVGQCLTNFIHPRDRVTFLSHLTEGLNVRFVKENKGQFGNQGQATFYCRIRQYNSLKMGFEISNKKPQYKPFSFTFHLKDLVNDDTSVEESNHSSCLIATIVPICSAYKVPEEVPAMTTFSTRHTSSCHFSHIDERAVPFIGYLPQDIIGKSVFEFYHSQDLPQLRDVYELVIKEQGHSFWSKPYRFRVLNGCFIILETEWSCFINPWSRKLEFVIANHRVLKGPEDPDVFGENFREEVASSEDGMKESQKIQDDIRHILSQTVKSYLDYPSKSYGRKRRQSLASLVTGLVDGMEKTKTEGDKEDPREDCSCSDHGYVVMGEVSPHQETNESDPSTETPPSLEDNWFEENIERFFASQPKTYSDGSGESKGEEKQTSGRTTDEENGKNYGSSENQSKSSISHKSTVGYGITDYESSSSSKRKMSSIITRDSGVGTLSSVQSSTEQKMDNSFEDSERKEVTSPRKEQKISNQCRYLTAHALSQHNRRGHKLLKQRKDRHVASANSAARKEACRPKENSKLFSKAKYLKTTRHQKSDIKPMLNTCTQTDQMLNNMMPVAFNLNPPFSLTSLSSVSQNTLITTTASTSSTSVTSSSAVPPVYTSTPANMSHPFIPYFSQPASSSGMSNPFYFPAMICFNAFPYYAPHPSQSTSMWPFTPMSSVNTTASDGDGAKIPSPENIQQLTPSVVTEGIAVSNQYSETAGKKLAGTLLNVDLKFELSHNRQAISKGNQCEVQKQKVKKNSSTGPKIRLKKVAKQSLEGDSSTSGNKDDLSLSYCEPKEVNSSYFDKFEPERTKKPNRVIRKDPPWLERVCLSSEVVYRYQLPEKQMEDVLKKDLKALLDLQQPDLVTHQLAQLHSQFEQEQTIDDADATKMKSPYGSNLSFSVLEEDLDEEGEKQEEAMLDFISGGM